MTAALRARRLVVALGPFLAAGLTLSACVSGTIPPLPAPPTTMTTSPATTLPDLTGVELSQVPGRTTTTAPAIAPGQAGMSGTVQGPQGPVPGAAVEVDRVTDAGTVGLVTTTAADGTWTMANILGGRYRVRAWLAPNLSMTQPVELFLGSAETRQVQLQLQTFGGTQARSDIAPRPPVVGQLSNLVVQVTTTAVDPKSGIVVSQPVAGAQILLAGSGSWGVDGDNPAITDGGGRATWTLVCQQAGPQPLTVQVGTDTLALDVPACVEPPPTTTTTTPSPSSSSTTSTSAGRTTTTTR